MRRREFDVRPEEVMLANMFSMDSVMQSEHLEHPSKWSTISSTKRERERKRQKKKKMKEGCSSRALFNSCIVRPRHEKKGELSLLLYCCSGCICLLKPLNSVMLGNLVFTFEDLMFCVHPHPVLTFESTLRIRHYYSYCLLILYKIVLVMILKKNAFHRHERCRQEVIMFLWWSICQQ